MGAILKAGDVGLDALEQLLAAAANAWTNYPVRVWLDAPDGWALDWWPGDRGQLRWYAAGRLPSSQPFNELLARSEWGRLFCPAGELKWRCVDSRIPRRYRAVYLGDEDVVGPELADRTELLKDLTRTEHRAFLWGQRTQVSEGDWIELRIPHRLQYPVDKPAQRLYLITELWLDGAGVVQFRRLCDIQPEGSSSHA